MDEFGFTAQVFEYFKRFEVPYKLALNEDDLRTQLPRDGMLLIHASWSSYSLQNMFKILKSIRERGQQYPEIVIADIDGLSSESMVTLIGRSAQGYAEGALLIQGTVAAVHTCAAELESFLEVLRGSSK
jgi:hypothetical protein